MTNKETKELTASPQDGGDKGVAYFSVSESKLTRLYLLTLGFYAFYWFYKNWKLQAPYMQKGIMPVWRSVFYIFFTHSLFSRISRSLESQHIEYKFSAGVIATIFVVLVLSGNVAMNLAELPDYPDYLYIVWLVTFFLSVYPLQEAQEAINLLNGDPFGIANSRYSLANILFMILGGLLWIFLLLGIAAMMLSRETNA